VLVERSRELAVVVMDQEPNVDTLLVCPHMGDFGDG
jgi:hypothetical protein